MKGLERTTPHHICQWSIPWKPSELGGPDKGGIICYIPQSRNWPSTSQMQTSHWGVTIFPLKWFLLKNTLNDQVNKWAVELEMYRIKFKHIKGKSIVLADTLSRLISIDPDVKLEPELEGYKFGQYCFEELPKASSYTVNEIITSQVIEAPWCRHHRTHHYILLTPTQFQTAWTTRIWQKLHRLHPRIKEGHLADSGYFIDEEDDLLWQRISDNLQDFKPVVLPNSLISTALLLTHDHTGHNGFRRNICSTWAVVLLERNEERHTHAIANTAKCVQSRR